MDLVAGYLVERIRPTESIIFLWTIMMAHFLRTQLQATLGLTVVSVGGADPRLTCIRDLRIFSSPADFLMKLVGLMVAVLEYVLISKG